MTQAALLQVAEATQRAADAAQAASAAATASSAAVAATSTAGGSSGSSSNRPQAQVDWSKLVNKPVFDFPNQEQDQQHWQLSQYLICVDEGFSKELTQITGDPSKMLDVDSASIDVRQRSAKLYGLLAGLVKNRALSKVRAAPPGNGYEALRQQMLSGRPDGSVGMALVLPALTDCRWWFESLLVHSGVSSATRRKATGADQKKMRQLVLSMRPNTQARGLSLLASVTAVADILDEQALTSLAFEAGGCIRGY